jgi:hypothetical protein
MTEEMEVGWLRLSDESDLVLTNLHVFQRQDQGIFGESQVIIPREAITTVQISWRRNRGLVVLGTLLVLVWLGLMVSASFSGFAPEQVLQLSSSALFSIQYGALLGGIALWILFWFYKRNEIRIMAPTETLGGVPQSYEDAQKFCSLMVSGISDQPAAGKDNQREETERPKTAEHDWQL